MKQKTMKAELFFPKVAPSNSFQLVSQNQPLTDGFIVIGEKYEIFCNLTNSSIIMEADQVLDWMKEHCKSLLKWTVLARCSIKRIK